MATPVVPSQFAVGKNRIIHRPTKATFSFDTAIPPSRVSIGDVRMKNYYLAQITVKTTSPALRSSC
jgi:hypothetical protein